MYYFCTYFDKNYLPLGLALYQSLVRHAKDVELNVLCLDDFTFQFLAKENLPNMKLISIDQLEASDQELARAKSNRSVIEYYYTLTPNLPLYLINTNPKIDVITYVDADLFFYSNPAPIYRELGAGSILIVPHRFAENMKENEKYGLYNLGLVSFRNDDVSRDCLGTWRAQCLEWCYEKPQDGKNGDQKYLDDWPELYKGVVILQNKGAGVGTWNVDNYSFVMRGNHLYVDDERLIFYHFHGFKKVTRFVYQAGRKLQPIILSKIYAPYISELKRIKKRYGSNTRIASVRARSVHSTRKFLEVALGYSILTFGPVYLEIHLRGLWQPISLLRKRLRALRRRASGECLPESPSNRNPSRQQTPK